MTDLSGARVWARPDLLAEPLVRGWHATPLLVPPVHSALVLAHRQLPILRSFLASPKVHADAMKDPSIGAG